MPRALAARATANSPSGKNDFSPPVGHSENRAVVDRAEQIDAHVDFGGVAQTARAQFDVLEPFAIGAQRAVVVDAAGHVGPMAGHHLAVRGFLEIEDVEGLGRDRNDVGSRRRRSARSRSSSRKAATPPSAAT